MEPALPALSPKGDSETTPQSPDTAAASKEEPQLSPYYQVLDPDRGLDLGCDPNFETIRSLINPERA